MQLIERETLGVFLILGLTMIYWLRKKHNSLVLSSAEAECIATSATSKESIWLHKLLVDFYGHELDVTMIFCDNQSYVKI